ncbi:MAG: hypothetical protein KAV70_07170, partial [Bacteroidales bacterium]|nr:hypothetical protein [Bacteroidales bacterium]
ATMLSPMRTEVGWADANWIKVKKTKNNLYKSFMIYIMNYVRILKKKEIISIAYVSLSNNPECYHLFLI